ncbi:MAG TPA: tRNA preQ1(34) S-adenosylmethionine ribosyltransferase-isomerase QueA [Limnochordales bacterium]|nr:tRNA preQ1(34) S-adenosylmethionine ribosyltransferase-isomerase QueA [Limnochordales bacterium]
MLVSDFDYDLPPALIAQQPVEPRDAARLLVVHRDSGKLEHRVFRDLPAYLRAGDVLVLNDTRVLPARLLGAKETTGGRVEVLLLRRHGPDTWEALVRPGRRVPVGTRIVFAGGRLAAVVLDRTAAGGRLLRFEPADDLDARLAELGQVPLPPYIREPLADPERYQTVYAREAGSAAAPTAGLHFTPALLERLRAQGVLLVHLTLHVGLGTFRPVQVERVQDHRMHAEFYAVPAETAAAVNEAKEEGRRVVAVGTTAARTLEAVADDEGRVEAGEGWTDLFIYPGYRWKVVDALVTNFHLPRSTLLMLVSAFLGRERTLAAYQEAVERGYRFFSFGDAMLIL